jgi:hypothetical protein
MKASRQDQQQQPQCRAAHCDSIDGTGCEGVETML